MERHRIVVAVALFAVPVAGLIGFGCSDDETPSVTMTTVDPGGTFGAEISVRVVGRGRVNGSIPGSIDCPRGTTSTSSPFPQTVGDCYVRYTFASETDKGAADGITLTATAADGARFVGWKFEAEQLGTKGRGPDTCSPVKRATTQPGDSNAGEIKLPFGKTTGSAPAGREGECFGESLEVPLAYEVVATFEDLPEPPDGGDAGDGGDGGTPGTILFEAPVAGATGGDLHLVNGRLYWRFNSGSFQGIASGPTSALAPATPQIPVPASTTIPKFEGDAYNVTFETATSTIGVFNASNPTAPLIDFQTVPGACDALETYQTQTLYCLYSGALYSWPLSGGARVSGPTSVPGSTGKPMAATFSYLWVVNDPGTTGGATIQRSSRSGADSSDGGTVTWDTTISGETNPIKLVANSSDYMAWIEYVAATDFGEVHASAGSSTVYTPVPQERGLKYVAHDTSSSSYVIAGVSPAEGTGGKIYRTTFTSSPISLTPVVTNIPNLTGIAADSSYYYWTQNDGRVYRKSKF